MGKKATAKVIQLRSGQIIGVHGTLLSIVTPFSSLLI